MYFGLGFGDDAIRRIDDRLTVGIEQKRSRLEGAADGAQRIDVVDDVVAIDVEMEIASAAREIESADHARRVADRRRANRSGKPFEVVRDELRAGEAVHHCRYCDRT